MTFNGWLQILLFCLVIIAITKPFGGYMTRVFAGERTPLTPVLRPVERMLYRLSGIEESAEQHWVSYAIAVLAFTLRRLRFAVCDCSGYRRRCRSTRRARAAVSPDLVIQHLG